MPGSHRSPSTHVAWIDGGGEQVTQWIVRRGLDRYGYVHQEQTLIWAAPTPAGLAEVRERHARDARSLVDLPPTDSWRFQYTEYGNNHVFLPKGLLLTDRGLIRTLPYSVMVGGLVMPALFWGVTRAWKRVRARATV